MREVLQRLERLEQQNQTLEGELRALRQELAVSRQIPGAVTPPAQELAEEKIAVNTNRIEELAQTKVETSRRLPLRITGTALFNAFLNGKYSGAAENPTTASLTRGPATGGATMRQTVIGLQYDSPEALFGSKVNGTMYLDLFGGTTQSLNHLLRLRVATIELNWKTRSFTVGQDKPIISPREPTSLAQVGVSPLTGAGNLWLWQPQAKFEQRFAFGSNSGLRAQTGLFQTNEASVNTPAEYAATLERARPALEGRFEFWRKWGEGRRLEIAPGFHTSSTHVAGTSVGSHIASVDWLANILPKVEVTGMFFSGQNVAGLGALRQGFTITNDNVKPVHSKGGWAQVHIAATESTSFNFYGGQQNDRASDLTPGGINKNQNYFANVMYRIAPNVIVSLEGGQVRTRYVGQGTRRNNHYDLAIGYLF
ncbi:MAG TPA: hypothetical protein VMZ52_16300 [Bryobacteraceae bacterium]|nr:hypothetical protein [Bryobacteraceae bacterium]